MKPAVVILGAGASRGANNNTSSLLDLAKTANLTPPLVGDLFDGSGAYAAIVDRYSGVQVLGATLAALAKVNGFSLEERLRDYRFSSSPAIRGHYQDVPLYLRDLLLFVEGHYVARPGSHLQLITELLGHRPHEVAFLVLNYDRYLEKAIRAFDPSLNFYSHDGRFAIAKLHGSVDWGYSMATSDDDFQPSGGDWAAEWRVRHEATKFPDRIEPTFFDVTEEQHSNQWHIRRGSKIHFLYPVLTAPLAGKDSLSIVCPDIHLASAEKIVRRSSKVLIVGCSGADEDLLQKLRDWLPAVDTVHVVEKGQAGDRVKANFSGVAQLANAPQWRVFEEGFAAYLVSPEFQGWAES